MTITFATYLFGATSVGPLWASLHSWQKDFHWSIQTYFTLVSISLRGFALFFVYWNWMGIRLWVY